MQSFHRILVPYDFSEGSHRALDEAVALCTAGPCAELCLLNVIGDPGFYVADATFPVVPPGNLLEDYRQTSIASLNKVATELSLTMTKITCESVIGSPSEEILIYARERGVDLICIGTHGRSGFSRFAMGSVAERVVQRSECPVLTVHQQHDAQPRVNGFRRVIATVDFSAASKTVVQMAYDLAPPDRTAIDLVHVIEDTTPANSDWGRSNPVIHARIDEMRAESESQLERFARPNRAVERHVFIGRPFVEIVKHAAESHADVIVIGTHGRTGAWHWFLGSVAEMVVRKATCPVLVIPHREART